MRKTLDQYEAERGDDGEPFEVEIGPDRVVALRHPKDMEFESLVNFDAARPAEVLRVLMGDTAFDDLIGATRPDGSKRVTLGVLGGILSDYMQHYGLITSPGEGSASPTSSNGSARPSKPTSRRKASA